MTYRTRLDNRKQYSYRFGMYIQRLFKFNTKDQNIKLSFDTLIGAHAEPGSNNS
jgi:hypothetical protein